VRPETSLRKLSARPHCSRKNSRSLSPTDLQTSVYLRNDPMLQTQMELAHSLISEMILKKEQNLSKFEKLTSFGTQSTGVLPKTWLSSNRLSHSSHKFKPKQGDLQGVKEQIATRIQAFTQEAHTTHRKELETHLIACWRTSGVSDGAVVGWLGLLRTLEAMDIETKGNGSGDLATDSDVWTAQIALENLKKRLALMTEDDRAQTENSDLLTTLQDITRAFRLLVKKVSDTSLLAAFDELWLTVCLLFDHSASLNDLKIQRAYIDIEHQAESERLKIKSSLQLMAEQWQSKLTEAKNQTDRIQTAFERLQLEKAYADELLKERESEISLMRNPDEMRDFENVVGEMAQHLEDMETRHKAQTVLLESIGELINGKNLKKHFKRKDELGHFLVKQATMKPGNWEYGRKGAFNESEVRGTRTRAFSTPYRLERPAVTKKPLLPTHLASEFIAKPRYPPIPEAAAVGETTPRDRTLSNTSSEEETDDKSTQTDPWRPTDTVAQQGTQVSEREATISQMKKRGGLFALLDDKVKRQPPMLNSNLFKLFEIAMADKLKSDLSENEQGRPAKNMAEFMLDFLFMQQGLKSLVIKSLAALLNGLEVLASKGHPYGVLFCRSLGVFVDRPFDNQLNAFLVRARAEFNDLQKSYKVGSGKGEVEYGGSALIVDIAERLLLLFPTYRHIAYEVVERVVMAGMTDFDKSCVVFCGRLAKIGRDFKLFFIQADPQKTGTMDESAFCSCAQGTFEICLSRPRLLEIYRYLTPGKLRTADILKLPFKDWASKALGKSAMVTKCDFLTILAEIYWQEEDKLRSKLISTFENRHSVGLLSGLSAFKALLQTIEPDIPDPIAAHLYREALDLAAGDAEDPDAVTKAAFCEISLRYRLGCEDLQAFLGDTSPWDTR